MTTRKLAFYVFCFSLGVALSIGGCSPLASSVSKVRLKGTDLLAPLLPLGGADSSATATSESIQSILLVPEEVHQWAKVKRISADQYLFLFTAEPGEKTSSPHVRPEVRTLVGPTSSATEESGSAELTQIPQNSEALVTPAQTCVVHLSRCTEGESQLKDQTRMVSCSRSREAKAESPLPKADQNVEVTASPSPSPAGTSLGVWTIRVQRSALQTADHTEASVSSHGTIQENYELRVCEETLEQLESTLQ